MEPPKEWPLKIRESYDPIRILGKGGFASVVLARTKTTNDNSGSSISISGSNTNNSKVAIKVVGGVVTEQRDEAVLYARREIEILKHVHHPNIIRLFDHWIATESNNKENRRGTQDDLTAAVLVLEYAKGPTVESLLNHGGALSTTFGRIVISQTIDAIAYLHSHAVLHRDIKPDNILVTGAMSSDDSIWDNEQDTGDDESILGGRHKNRSEQQPNWKALRSKFKVTLIDFGFARALTPNDVSKPSHETSLKDSKLASYHRIFHDSAYRDRKGNPKSEELGSSQRSTKSARLRKRINWGILDSSAHRLLNQSRNGDELSRSNASHKIRRTMSALGNKNFAAPEIVNQVRPAFRKRVEPRFNKTEQGTTETISSYVADYGLLVDSYSMGHTIRYMMTGVQPGISVEDAIFQQSGGCLGKVFSLCVGTSNNNKSKRSVRYRSMDELPGDIYRLVGAMTQISEQKRISIRQSRWNVPWIADVLESQTTTGENDVQKEETAQAALSPASNRISHLPFATTHTNTTTTKKTTIRESTATVATVPYESALTF